MSNLKVLIAGGGVAGPATGFFLSQAGAEVTVLERAASLRTAGQNVDIRGAGRQVLKLMGIEKEVQEQHTTEHGMMWVDADNKCIAPFPVSEDGDQSLTAATEVLRADLAKIIYDATKAKMTWKFGEHITEMVEVDDKTRVTLASGIIEDYDVVVVADGLGSRTRQLAFPEFGEQWMQRTGMYMAFFSIPGGPTDTDWSRWLTIPGRRSVMLRPDNKGRARIVLSVMNGDPRLEEVLSQGQTERKALMRELFQGAGWELERILDGMDVSDDFYMVSGIASGMSYCADRMQDKIAQTRMPCWSRGHVVVVGDAGYCPSPITGMGTTLALVGSYVLAGEIAKAGRNVQLAFTEYERVLRPFVEKAQKIFPGAPGLIHPETSWGVSLLYRILSFVSYPIVQNTLTKIGGGSPASKFDLPVYNLAAAA